MIRNGKKREWVRRLMAIFLCLLLVMPSAPFSIGGIYTAKADEKRCPECEEYKDAVFCEKCGKCEDCVEICDHCGEICLNCHEEEFEAEGTTEAEPCGDCMRCKVGVDYCGYCGRCEECVELCDRCDEHICMECHAELAEDAVDEYCPCPDCGRCKGDGTPYCLECGICEDCAEICPYCEMCENCWEQDHCEFCNACMEYAGWCLDGGTHCIDCCELCDGCGYCFLTEEREKCDICGYCMDCCEDQGCPECGLCVEDDTYQDHLCGECGACLIENEVCEVCGLCRECCLDQLLQLGYTGDDRCYLEISDEDFCADCGICFLDGEICETCLEVGEYRCKECCALLSYEKGCDCESPVCVNSEEFAIHMENEHSEYVDAHQATPKNTWNMDLNSHWHDCRYCNEESHRFDLASHRFDENGRCTVCGYLSTDKIIIARQPYDAEVTATYNGWCENSSLPPECPGDRLATFSVIAYGKNGVKGLDYQWHQVIDYGSTTKDITLEENTNPYTDYVTGAKLPVLRVGIGVDVCYRNFWYYCVITDDEGNEVRTRNAQMNAVHRYEVFDPNTCQRTREGHRLHCVCKQCVGVSDLKPHTFGNWEWQTDESGAQTGKVRTCSVCGFEETVAVHEHNYDYSLLYDVNNEDVNVIKENDRTNEYEYEFTYNGKTIRMRIDRVGHSVDCSVPGCTFRQKEKHNWGHYQIINNAAETHHGTVYRTCKDCGMDETWLRTYYDWHTHPVNVSNGDADVDFAEEDTIVCVEPKFVDGKRVIGGVARINYKSTAGPSVRNNQATISLTEVDPGKLYNFRVPASGENGTRTVNGRVYTCYDEYGAEQIEVTFEYADCTHQETILTGQEEADCTRDGYTGDEICNYCGHIVTKGSYLAPNGHGEKVLATENIYETDRWGNIQVDKRGNNKYIVHAPETVYCDEENSRGCYTGDYICQDCGVVLEYGKYTSKQHNFIPFEELSEYHQNKYGNLLHLRSYQAPVGDQEGYSGDWLCLDCLNGPTAKYGHTIRSKFITKLDIRVTKLPEFGKVITTDDIIVPEQVELTEVLWYNPLLDEEYEPDLLLNSIFDPAQMELRLIVKPKEGFWFKDYDMADTAEGSVAAYVNGKRAQLVGFVTSSEEYRNGCLVIDAKELGFTGTTLSGTIKSSGDEKENIYITLDHIDYPGLGFSLTVTGNEADYRFNASSGETYVLKIMKNNHVTYETELAFEGEEIELNVTLEPLSGWKQDSTGWWYQNPDGTYPKNQWKQIDEKWYYFNKNGYRVTGWQDIGSKRYYFDENGIMQTGWLKDGDDYYYLRTDGSMASDEWVDDGKYYVDEDGKWIKGKVKPEGEWKQDSKGWWFRYEDGTYPKSEWKEIDGNRYYFEASGYRVTGLKSIEGVTYYFDENGVMQTGFVSIEETTYYFDENGVMQTGFVSIEETTYYFDENGIMQTAWVQMGDDYYYFHEDGTMARSEWVEGGQYYVDENGKWIKGKTKERGMWKQDAVGYWYQNEDGTYPKNQWKQIDGKWYYFNKNGYRMTGWAKLSTRWYYFNENGIMQTGWLQKGSSYYYLKADGSMAVDEWIDGKYYVDADGKWIKDKIKETGTWKKDSKGWWYQNEDGTYPKSQWKQIDGKWYYFDRNGYRKTGWFKLSDKWYYFDENGIMQTGWLQSGTHYYYLKANGSMAVNEWVDGGRYYVDANGYWIKDAVHG